MTYEPYTIDRTYDAPVSRVWKALTDKRWIRMWFFEVEEFEARPGFEFRCRGGGDQNPYLLLCTIKEVLPMQKLSYTWCYEGYPGESLVSIELFEEGKKTRLRLTHAGLETFPKDRPDIFGREKFVAGWNYLIGESLPHLLKEEDLLSNY
jgi:uncharacterized protein YndB with AHSA1/START domain